MYTPFPFTHTHAAHGSGFSGFAWIPHLAARAEHTVNKPCLLTHSVSRAESGDTRNLSPCRLRSPRTAFPPASRLSSAAADERKKLCTKPAESAGLRGTALSYTPGPRLSTYVTLIKVTIDDNHKVRLYFLVLRIRISDRNGSIVRCPNHRSRNSAGRAVTRP